MTERLAARAKIKAQQAQRRELILAERHQAEQTATERAQLKAQLRREARTAPAEESRRAVPAEEPRRRYRDEPTSAPEPRPHEPELPKEPEPPAAVQLAPSRDDVRLAERHAAKAARRREQRAASRERARRAELDAIAQAEQNGVREVERSSETRHREPAPDRGPQRAEADGRERAEADGRERAEADGRERHAEIRDRKQHQATLFEMAEERSTARAELRIAQRRNERVESRRERAVEVAVVEEVELDPHRHERRSRKRDAALVAQTREHEAAIRKAQLRAQRNEQSAERASLEISNAARQQRRAPAPEPPPADDERLDDERLNEDAGLPPLGEEPSGKRLLRLRTAGGFIVDELGTGFNLRGVTILGLDAASPGADQSLRDALSLDDANLTALSNWSINVVRLPFLAATVMSGNGTLTAASILAGLDDLVAALVATKTYTLLSLQAPITPGAVVAALPDQTTFDAWSLLAARYANETGVLFEIYSSPLPISGDWLDAVQMLIGAIRSRHPASLLFAGGGAGGSDVTGLPLRFSTGDPTPNIVSTIRVAAGRQLPSDEHALAALAESFPVVATDWSAAEASSLDRAPELAANTFARLGIGWVAGNWNGDPRLVVASQSHGMTPTRWGTTVARAVTLPQRLPLEKLLPDATST